jgi:hypothetical protein
VLPWRALLRRSGWSNPRWFSAHHLIQLVVCSGHNMNVIGADVPKQSPTTAGTYFLQGASGPLTAGSRPEEGVMRILACCSLPESRIGPRLAGEPRTIASSCNQVGCRCRFLTVRFCTSDCAQMLSFLWTSSSTHSHVAPPKWHKRLSQGRLLMYTPGQIDFPTGVHDGRPRSFSE